MKERKKRRMKIAFFGHFDATNLGNESTLLAILHHVRQHQPDAEVTCISTGAEQAIAASHQIEAIPISQNFVEFWSPQSRLLRLVRRVVIGLPSELLRCVAGLVRLKRTDVLIVAGTGLLTDAYGLTGWGPYNLLKWALMAKLCRCKLLFVSVGAGPFKSAVGKWLVKSALSLADFRSYRDNSSVQCLHDIGFRTGNDPVYPDLAFSLPLEAAYHAQTKKRQRTVVGLGVMAYSGQYKRVSDREQINILQQSDTRHLAYLKSLADLAEWLLDRENDVRLLIGDLADVGTAQAFKCLMRDRPALSGEARIIDEPIRSVDDLLLQIAATDIVIATRFHNVLLALLCEKPVISISFHHKCASLMSAMGLSDYCLNINDLKTDRLIEKFCDAELGVDRLKALIGAKVAEFREALDEQYRFIFNDRWRRPDD